MKRIAAILLAILMVLSLAACAGGNGTSGSKILAAYFSATNNIGGVAQKLADGLGADLYEIVPEQPYADLGTAIRP